MELLAVIGITIFFGVVALSAIAQRATPPAPVIYLKAEPVERRDQGDGGLGLILVLLAILGAIWLL
jgi:hypothetical protein